MFLTLSSTFKQESEHTCASAGPLLPPAVGTAPPVSWNLHLPLQVETLGFREPYNLQQNYYHKWPWFGNPHSVGSAPFFSLDKRFLSTCRVPSTVIGP